MKKVFKKHGKKLLIESLVGAIFATIIVYVIVGPYNAEFTKLLQTISDKNIACNVCLIMFPAFLIINFTIKLAMIVAKEK